MEKGTIATVFVSIVLIGACQNSLRSQDEDPWKDKHITAALLNLTSHSAAEGTRTTYSLGYEETSNQVTLTLSNPSTLPIALRSLTIHNGKNNECIVQAAGNYHIPAGKTANFNVTDFKTFENCVLGYNEGQSGRYRISIDNNTHVRGGQNANTSTASFVMTIEYKQNQTTSEYLHPGLVRYTSSFQF